VTAERMVRLTLGQQGFELFPDGLDKVRLECGHEVYAPSSREASDTPRMIEHLVSVYTLICSLLAEPLKKRKSQQKRQACLLQPVVELRAGVSFEGLRPSVAYLICLY
jgi:hypothetical protein